MIKRYINRIAIIASLCLAVLSCNKAVIDYNSDFKGHWKTGVIPEPGTGVEVESHFLISDTHNEFGLHCKPNCFNCECTKYVQGRAQVNTDRSKMRIGQSGNTYTVTITKEPYLTSDSSWVCELNGVVYYKQ
jgi:hypothetical protein